MKNDQKNNRKIFLWLAAGLMLFALVNSFLGAGAAELPQELAFSDFMQDVANGQVQQVTIQGQQLTGLTVEGRQFETFVPDDTNLVSQSARP